MGGHGGWVQSSGFFPNGLLPNESASVTQLLDPERWSQAEERTAELIACIQPNQPSEERRQAVASYVQRLITKCFSCQVFTFGSVPLKTYLPDGDIDLTTFSKNHNSNDNWANEVQDMLKREEKSEDAEFHVKEVQYIQAEVKIIKCLVENIVVDISFNQLGGLCTLCFLEEVNHLISQNHLFKRSIILIKAWCYYESRILGAHHGLISTYALETLVLYIFHVYNNSFSGPLEVLYRFLEFFSKFDWENFCLSLWGPVPISSLPDMTGKPPRKDGGELLLSKVFLDACSSVYAVFPGGLENQDQPFVSKHFNVIDPLRTNNNLGRSVSKGNFFRIRSAFAFGAQRLARLLDCPKENLIAEVNQFFSNTWDRHGKRHRPDAPSLELYTSRGLNTSQVGGSTTLGNGSNSKAKERGASNECEADSAHTSQGLSSQHINHSLKLKSRTGNNSDATRNENQNMHANLVRSVGQNHHDLPSIYSKQNSWADKGRNFGTDNIGNELHAMYQFARTHSSPELTDTCTEVPGKVQTACTRSDNSKRRNFKPEVSDNCSSKPSNWSADATVFSNASNGYYGESGLRSRGKENLSVAETMQMHQEEQDLVNMMASSYSFNGQVHVPVNLASVHHSHHAPPSLLPSLGYAHRNSAGMIPTNIPSFESSWMHHYTQDLVSLTGSQYFPYLGMASYREELTAAAESNLVTAELKSDDSNPHGFWPKQGAEGVGGYDHRNINPLNRQPEDRQQFTSSSSESSNSPHRRNREADINISSSITPPSSPSRTNSPSESSKDESPSKSFKSTRDRQGRKLIPPIDPSVLHMLDENGREYVSESVDHSSSQVNHDNQEWISLSTIGTEVPGYESVPICPSNPGLLGSASGQKAKDNTGDLPFTFYPTGPPIPFLTMLPLYNVPMVTGTTATTPSTNHLDIDEGLNRKSLDLTENLGQTMFNNGAAFLESSEECKSQILNGDFASHWQNLQYGRLCQSSQQVVNGDSVLYPSSADVGSVYLKEQFPWDGPGRGHSGNVNLLTQLMAYSPHLIPISSLQHSSMGHASVYQPYADEIPRYRGGTGTYLPNPKISPRDRQSSYTRNHRDNNSCDKKDHHSDREGNWNNTNTKSRFANRSQGRNQTEKPSTRIDRTTSNNTTRFNKPYKPDPFPSYQSRNGSFNYSASVNRGSGYSGYGVYPLPLVNPAVSSLPYDQNVSYIFPADLLDFGALRKMQFSGLNESRLGEGSSSVVNEQWGFIGGSAHSSPDQPSSPEHHRKA